MSSEKEGLSKKRGSFQKEGVRDMPAKKTSLIDLFLVITPTFKGWQLFYKGGGKNEREGVKVLPTVQIMFTCTLHISCSYPVHKSFGNSKCALTTTSNLDPQAYAEGPMEIALF